MNVRAKVKCTAIDPAPIAPGGVVSSSGGTGGVITFEPAPRAEDDAFHTYSVVGPFQLSTLNMASLDQCEVGKEYYVDVSPVEAAAVQQPRTLPDNLPGAPAASLEPGLLEQFVVALMASSKSEAEWKQNSDHVLKLYGGYPAFWQEAIVGSGLYRRVKSSFEVDTTSAQE